MLDRYQQLAISCFISPIWVKWSVEMSGTEEECGGNSSQELVWCEGACAVVVAGVLEGKTDRNTRVDLPGGPLQIEWRESDGHVYMTGPAELVFAGSLIL